MFLDWRLVKCYLICFHSFDVHNSFLKFVQAFECMVLVGNVKGRDHCEDLDMEGRIILDWILKT